MELEKERAAAAANDASFREREAKLGLCLERKRQKKGAWKTEAQVRRACRGGRGVVAMTWHLGTIRGLLARHSKLHICRHCVLKFRWRSDPEFNIKLSAKVPVTLISLLLVVIVFVWLSPARAPVHDSEIYLSVWFCTHASKLPDVRRGTTRTTHLIIRE